MNKERTDRALSGARHFHITINYEFILGWLLRHHNPITREGKRTIVPRTERAASDCCLV